MSLFGISPAGKIKKAARIISDAKSLGVRDPAGARRKLDEAVTLLRSVAEQTPDRQETIAEGLLALATIERLANNNARAAQLLEEAVDLGVTLMDADWVYLTTQMALTGRTDVRSMETYVDFASQRAREPDLPLAGPIYDLLERSCILEESTTSEERARRLGLCSRLISADRRLGFPYYFRGRHAFYTGNYSAALEDFQRAGERAYSPPDLGFFIHACTGIKRRDEGHADQAAYCFVEAARQNPNSYVANYEAGACLVELCRKRVDDGAVLGEVDASRRQYAIALLERAVQIQDRSAPAYFMLGCAYYLDRKAEEAASALRKAVTLQPCAAYYYEYARALRRTRAQGEAIAAAEEALRLQPSFLKARSLIASISMRQRDFRRSAEEYRAIVAALPADHNGHLNAVYGLGVCCFELGDNDGAIQAFHWLEGQDLELNAEGRLILARSLMRRGDLESAAARLAELAHAVTEKGDALYYLGCCQARQGRLEEAIETLKAAEAAGAPAHKAALQRGMAHESLGRLDDAQREYERAIAKHDSSDARLRISYLLKSQDRHAEAMEHLEKAPPTPDVLAAKAELYAAMENKEAAETAFETALAEGPGRSDLRLRYGATLLRWGDGKRAEEAMGGCQALNSASPELIRLLGAARLHTGDARGALDIWGKLKTASERDDLVRSVALHAARRARASGNYECAVELWGRAIQAGTVVTALRADCARAWVGAALQKARSGGGREAWEPLVRRALETDTENPDFVLLESALNILSGDPSCCVERIESLRDRIAPGQRPGLDYLLGLACLRQENWSGAETCLRAAIAEGDGDLQRAARIPCSAALAQLGRWRDAAEVLHANSTP